MKNNIKILNFKSNKKMELEKDKDKIEEEMEENKLILNFNDTSNIKNSNVLYIEKIKNLLELIINQNNLNKKYKISLFKIRGFDPVSIFNEIDTISSGFINDKDLEEYLSKNNIKTEQKILHLFFRQFNKEGKDKNLWRKDFLGFIYFDVNKKDIKTEELNNFNKDEINQNFLNLIKSEFEFIRERNKLINEILQIKDFSTFEAFNLISINKNFIDYNNTKQFLGNKYQDNEIKELIYRFDLNNDKKISYEEFQDIFFPFQSHLHLDIEEKKEKEDFIENKNYITLDIYKNFILSSPNIIDEDENDLKEEEIKININNSLNKRLNEFNENNSEGKKEFNDEDLKIKYDEKLINKLNQEKHFYNDNNYKIYDNVKLKCEGDKIKSYIFSNDLNKTNSNDNNLLKEKEKNKDSLHLDEINNINIISEKQKKSLSKSEIVLSNSNINLNNATDFKKTQIKYILEDDKDIVRLFIDFIQSIIILENMAEDIKETIILYNEITSLELFYMFNIDNDDLISKKNFLQICNNKFYFYPTEKQIKLLFDRYDLDNDGFFNLNEFINMISPLRKEYLALNKKEGKRKKMKNINFEYKIKVIELFKRIIENENLIYDLKMKIKTNKKYNFVFLWGIMMKYSNDGKKMDKNEFNCFLETFQCFLTNFELDIIFYKLSMGNSEIKYDSLYKQILL